MIYPEQGAFLGGKPERGPDGKLLPVPENSVWWAHDPAIYKDENTGVYYAYCTHNLYYKSKDLIHWERMGRIIDKTPEEVVEYVGGEDVWAPDIDVRNGEYRLYFSCSKFGVCRSIIFLMVADHPEGPWTYRGIAMKTDHDSERNAIDANIIEDVENGKLYMPYGSFWRGIYMIELDPKTGLAKEEGYGRMLATRPLWSDAAVEGAYVRYNKKTGYYYLFVSYGSLNSDYNVRVGRSKNITGPYEDPNGREMTDFSYPDYETGFMMIASYQFGKGEAYMAPGHNSVLQLNEDEWFMVCHIRPCDFDHGQVSLMHVYPMLWTRDGWPVISPSVYAGEKKQIVKRSELIGRYDRISLLPTIPQGLTTSFPMELTNDGHVRSGSILGSWQLNQMNELELQLGPLTETYLVIPCWNYDKDEPTLMLTGKDDKNHACFARKQ